MAQHDDSCPERGSRSSGEERDARWRRAQVARHNYELAADYGFYDPLISGSVDGTDEAAHDRACVRAAAAAHYVPNVAKSNDVDDEARRTLFVGRIEAATASEATLREHFERHGGPVRRVRLVRDLVTGYPRGYAFVVFERRRDAERAHRNAHAALPLQVGERRLVVEFELERVLAGWRPRRLGGGFGGSKKSGQLRFGGRYKPFARISRRRPVEPHRHSSSGGTSSRDAEASPLRDRRGRH